MSFVLPKNENVSPQNIISILPNPAIYFFRINLDTNYIKKF